MTLDGTGTTSREKFRRLLITNMSATDIRQELAS